MSKKRALGRSLEEWMELVTECRQSGLTDAVWLYAVMRYSLFCVYLITSHNSLHCLSYF